MLDMIMRRDIVSSFARLGVKVYVVIAFGYSGNDSRIEGVYVSKEYAENHVRNLIRKSGKHRCEYAILTKRLRP